MHLIFLALIALCCASCRHCPRSAEAPPARSALTLRIGQHEDYESHFEGVSYFFLLNNVIWEKQSAWRAESEPLPLPPQRAEQAAIAAARRLRPDVRDWACDFLVLERVDTNAWFYVVSLGRTDVASAGLPESLTIPVLLNGAAVQPVVRR